MQQDDSFTEALKALAAANNRRVCLDGDAMWAEFPVEAAALPTQGWKVHVSCCSRELPSFAQQVVEPLLASNACFKVARSASWVRTLNSSETPGSQAGKVLTLYPRDATEFAAACNRLADLWPQSAGPPLRSDLWVRGQPHLGIRFGAFGRDPKLTRPDGRREEDHRSILGNQPDWAPAPGVDAVPPTLDLRDADLEIAGEVYRPIHLLSTSAKGSVFLALRQGGPRTCVMIKTAVRGIHCDEAGDDARCLLAQEAMWLRRLGDQGLPVPRVHAFVEGLYAYLVMDDLVGMEYGALPRPMQIALLPELATLVGRMHRLGVAHQDLKPSNVLCTEAGLRLIDFELARALEGALPQGGTLGYVPTVKRGVSPEQRDVFALGSMLFEAALGMAPSSVPEGDRPALLRLHGMGAQARLLERVLSGSLNAEAFAAACAACRSWRRRVRPAQARVARATERLLHEPCEVGPWAWEQPAAKAGRQCLYDGASGQLLGLASLRAAGDSGDSQELLHEGAAWLAAQDWEARHPGLFEGQAGMALALAVLGRRLHVPAWTRRARDAFAGTVAGCLAETDLFRGAAGVVWAGSLLAAVLEDESFLALAQPAVERLMTTAQHGDGGTFWPVFTERHDGQPTLGVSHGTAGIAMALACWARASGDDDAYALSQKAVLALHSHGRTSDGRQLRMHLGMPEAASNTSWCHGPTGLLWALQQGFAHDPRIHPVRRWCELLVTAQAVGGGTSYCHGLAGRLEALRMLGTPRAARAAERVVAGLHFVASSHAPAHPGFWPRDKFAPHDASLWRGSLGPRVALAMHRHGGPQALMSAPWLQRLALRTS